MRRHAWLGAALLAVTACSPAAAGEPIRPIAAIRSLPLSAAREGETVRIRGVITFRDVTANLRTITVQDATDATWVEVAAEVPPAVIDRLTCGAEVEAAGRLDPGGFAPRLLASEINVLGEGTLPEPQPADIERLFTGADNCRRMTVDGVVQGWRQDGDTVRLVVAKGPRRLFVRVDDALAGGTAAAAALVDARAAFTGVVTATRNTRGEFLRPGLNVARPADIRVVEPAPGSAFDAPAVPLDAIAGFRPEPDLGHRIRTTGMVTRVFPGRWFFIQQGLIGVRVQSEATELPRRGDWVEVAGFPEMGRRIGGLTEAVFRPAATSSPIAATVIQPAEILAINEESRQAGEIAQPGNYDGCLVACRGILLETFPPSDDLCRLTLADDGTVFMAVVPASEEASLARLRRGSVVDLSGIVALRFATDDGRLLAQDPAADRLDLLVESAGDITVVSVPSWWTPRRLGMALAATLGLCMAALAIIQTLRRRIAHQAVALAEEVQSRREAAIEFQAALRERHRLAANLHDTVLQTVTGIGFQLRACDTLDERGETATGGHFRVARRMVAHAVQQLRGTVWALHALPTSGESLPEAVAALVERLAEGQSVPIVSRAEGVAFEVPEFIAGSMLLVAQEAIHNAFLHARSTRIEVTTEFGPDGLVSLAVQDDGVGFMAGDQPGSSRGHFGIEGMRDRMQRVGGVVEIESAPGRGTTVIATAQVAGFAAPPTDLSESPVSGIGPTGSNQ